MYFFLQPSTFNLQPLNALAKTENIFSHFGLPAKLLSYLRKTKCISSIGLRVAKGEKTKERYSTLLDTSAF